MKNKKSVTITKNGPYLISGDIPLAKELSIAGKSGYPEKWKKGKKYSKQESYALCRCGGSCNKPFCDGSHIKNKFNGTETASKKVQCEKLSGPELELTDAFELCSAARFCHLANGTWNNVEKSNNKKSKEIAIQTACNCPSGRLVVFDKKTKKPFENKFEPSISLIEDTQAKVSGPIWVKGGIEIKSADGTIYETRNRVTLCRCGKSKNKPFCDGSHIEEKFNDEDESLK
ncbi:MAG: CDGSH iron-sulfur domain-containing protein [Candidatus Nanoarchaeia archaeon]|nr:CDGSH iron-sulfur domain-containing protein [Candidatus Nanoarchaeia archaeon]